MTAYTTKNRVTKNFSLIDVQVLESMPVSEAKDAAHALLDNAVSHPKYPFCKTKAKVIGWSIDSAKTTAQISRLFYSLIMKANDLA